MPRPAIGARFSGKSKSAHVPPRVPKKKGRAKKKPPQGRRGRPSLFTNADRRLLEKIIEDRAHRQKHISRSKIREKFEKKSGKTIAHLQRISEVTAALGYSCKKTSSQGGALGPEECQKRVEKFWKKQIKVPFCHMVFVDEINLPDAAVPRVSYSRKGEPAIVRTKGQGSGRGSGIVSCTWRKGMGPSRYIRHKDKGTRRTDFIKYLRDDLLPTLEARDVLYLDQARIHIDDTGEIKQLCAKKEVKVRYLPSNCTHLASPLDQQPFAMLRTLWCGAPGKNAKTAAAVMAECIKGIQIKLVRDGIKAAGYAKPPKKKKSQD